VVSGGKRLGPAAASLVAWLVLALVNQVLITATAVEAPLGTRLLLRLYDAGQLVAHRTVEVYDLERDAAELRNLVDTSAPAVERAIETAKLFFGMHSPGGRERIAE
jgi:hypothetical protein